MSRARRLRTPEGAWYSNYEGYKRGPTRDEYFDTHADNERERRKKESELLTNRGSRNPHHSDRPAEMTTEYERNGGALGGRPPLFDRAGFAAHAGRRPSGENEYLGERAPDPKGVRWQASRHLPLGGQPRSEWEREWDPASSDLTPRRHDPPPPKKLPIWEREQGQNEGQGQGYRGDNEYLGVRGVPGLRSSSGLWDSGQRTEWEREWQPGELSPRRPLHDVPEQRQSSPSPPPPASPGRRGGGGGREWEAPSPAGRGAGGYDPSFLQPSSPRRGADNGLGQDRADYDYMKGVVTKGVDPRMAVRNDAKASEGAKLKVLLSTSRGAFMFIRFPLGRGENVHNVEKWCVQAKPQNMGGQFLGIARRVFDYGFTKEPQEGCAVFQFNSLGNAQIFFDSDHRLKQPDFPPPQGHADIFSIEMDEVPPNIKVYDTFLYSEITLSDGLSEASLAQYEVAFKHPFTRLLQDPQFDCKPYVCYSTMPETDRKMHRKHFFGPKVIVAVHLFRGPVDLEQLMKDQRYSYLRSIHNAMAQEKCSIFTVGRSACP